MSKLLQVTFDLLGSKNHEEIREGLYWSLVFFEASRGILSLPDAHHVLSDPATPAELNLLSDRLVELVHTDSDLNNVGMAVFALGKLCDLTLQPLYIQVLRDFLEIDRHVLWQAIVALENIGVEVFVEENQSHSLTDECFRDLVRAYLDQISLL